MNNHTNYIREAMTDRAVKELHHEDGYMVLAFRSEVEARDFKADWVALAGEVFDDTDTDQDESGYWCVDAYYDPAREQYEDRTEVTA